MANHTKNQGTGIEPVSVKTATAMNSLEYSAIEPSLTFPKTLYRELPVQYRQTVQSVFVQPDLITALTKWRVCDSNAVGERKIRATTTRQRRIAPRSTLMCLPRHYLYQKQCFHRSFAEGVSTADNREEQHRSTRSHRSSTHSPCQSCPKILSAMRFAISFFVA